MKSSRTISCVNTERSPDVSETVSTNISVVNDGERHFPKRRSSVILTWMSPSATDGQCQQTVSETLNFIRCWRWWSPEKIEFNLVAVKTWRNTIYVCMYKWRVIYWRKIGSVS